MQKSRALETNNAVIYSDMEDLDSEVGQFYTVYFQY